MNLVSWVFENYIEKLSFPWGFNECVDSFTGFMYFKNVFFCLFKIFIKGKFNLFSSTNKKTKDDFDFIQFIDTIPASQRQIINDNFKFYLSLVDFRQVSFFDSMQFILDPNFPPLYFYL